MSASESLVRSQTLVPLEVVRDTVVVSVASVQVLEVDTSVVVSVQGVVVSVETLVQASLLEVVGDTVVVSVETVTLAGEDVTGVTLRESASGGAQVESLGLEGGEIATDDSSVYNGSDLSVDGGGLDELLVNRLGVLDDSGLDDVTLEDGLDLLDDGLLDDLVDDGGVYNLSAEGGVDLTSGGDVVLGDGSGSLDDGLSGLGGKLSLLDDGGLDLSLVHHLGDLLDVELFSLSVDDRLNLLLHDGVDSLLDDDVLLDGLDDGGLRTDESERSSLSRLDVGGLAESKSLLRVQDTVTISVQRVDAKSLVQGSGSRGGGLSHTGGQNVGLSTGEVIQIDSAVAISVERVTVGESLLVIGDTIVISVVVLEILEVDTSVVVSVEGVV